MMTILKSKTTKAHIDYQLKKPHWIALILLAVAIAFASIHPLELSSYILHQVGTVFMLVTLIICLYKMGLSLISFMLYIGFLLIHILGAHYLYSYVPYNEWSIQYLNLDLNQSLGWTRNMYDRFVHLAYGLLLYPFFYRLFPVWLPQLSKLTLFLLVIQFVMASSLIYEWIEWFIAMGLSPEDAENYNGQQGGIFLATALGTAMAWLTPFSYVQAACIGLVVCIFGFFGGLVMSAIKRDRGVKDWGQLIHGHGGMLDRIDSICFSAPIFFHILRYWWS